jgi:transcriptional regulator with XRE-family HTH domain
MNGVYNKLMGLRIKQLRQNLGLTQDDVAKRCEMKQQTIDNVENARFDVGIGTITFILRALGAELSLKGLDEVVYITWIDSTGKKKRLDEIAKSYEDAIESVKEPESGYDCTLMNYIAVRVDGKLTKAFKFFEENQAYLDTDLENNAIINKIVEEDADDGKIVMKDDSDKDRFLLQKSKEKENGWLVTDAERGIVIKFDDHKFNDTQEIVLLEDIKEPDAIELATAMTEIAEWLRKYHYKIAM